MLEYKLSSTCMVCGGWRLYDVACYTFQGLIKSNARQDQQEGVRLLSDIFRTSQKERECLYYLALGTTNWGTMARHEIQRLVVGEGTSKPASKHLRS